MQGYVFAVQVTAESYEKALIAMVERLEPDENYGFPYSIQWLPIDMAASRKKED